MTGILKVDSLQSGTTNIAVSNMQRRIIQRINYTHRIGWWRSDNTYYWVPGGYMDFRPIRSDSRIRFTYSIPTRQRGSQQHSIQHWIFYLDDEELGRFSRGGHHTENAFPNEWDVPSWGAGTYRRAGFKVRSYSDNVHCAHLYLTQYWNGSGQSLNLPGQMIVEEYTSAPLD